MQKRSEGQETVRIFMHNRGKSSLTDYHAYPKLREPFKTMHSDMSEMENYAT